MILLALGVLATSLMHLVAAVPSLKSRVKAGVGERAYGPLFGLASLVGIAIIVAGWKLSDFVAVYEPPAWGRHANFGFMLAAFLCFGIFLFRGRLRQLLRFPMGFAVIFWATGHLLANGDLASLILFGGFLLYAVAHIVIGIANGVRPSPEVRGGHDLVSLVMGVALYGVMVQLHGALIGVPVFDVSQWAGG
ncbi:MAG TPA: NnrU family protein [Aestuariivirga sp.]|nr:hypothetical protein [Alphaproteobacteria bacterium]HRX36628.1 NnrU family protein [Aestuariivirga sp.]